MKPTFHDIVNCLMIARGYANALAEEIESSEPQRARVLKDFGEELWKVWQKHAPELLTHLSEP